MNHKFIWAAICLLRFSLNTCKNMGRRSIYFYKKTSSNSLFFFTALYYSTPGCSPYLDYIRITDFGRQSTLSVDWSVGDRSTLYKYNAYYFNLVDRSIGAQLRDQIFFHWTVLKSTGEDHWDAYISWEKNHDSSKELYTVSSWSSYLEVYRWGGLNHDFFLVFSSHIYTCELDHIPRTALIQKWPRKCVNINKSVIV